jgi:hypothetical protein
MLIEEFGQTPGRPGSRRQAQTASSKQVLALQDAAPGLQVVLEAATLRVELLPLFGSEWRPGW